MNKLLKKILLGLLIWAVPFVTSFFVWDVEANAPSISMQWFNALMGFTWALGFGLAAYWYYKDVKKDHVAEGWKTGVLWYVEMLALDLAVLVGAFGMTLAEYYPFLLYYANAIILSVAIGYIRK